MIDLIRKYCLDKEIKDRTQYDIFHHLEGEVTELEEELYHHGYVTSSEDGVFGESIDVILCAFDLIFKDNPDITNEQIEAYVVKKLNKWKYKSNK